MPPHQVELTGQGWREHALDITWPTQLPGSGAHSVGVLSCPTASPPARRGVILLAGGGQTRWGAHRQFVEMARQLAQAGWPTLRFDWPGLGDADGEHMDFAASGPWIDHAIDLMLAQLPALDSVVLVGLCDGASAALLSTPGRHRDRIQGLVLINTWMRTEQSLASARLKHYYWQRLKQPAFWLKLLRAQVGWQAGRHLLGNLHKRRAQAQPDDAPFPQRMAIAFRQFKGHVLVLTSSEDLTGQEFLIQVDGAAAWQGARRQAQVTWTTLEGADHTCSTPDAHQVMQTQLLTWLHSLD